VCADDVTGKVDPQKGPPTGPEQSPELIPEHEQVTAAKGWMAGDVRFRLRSAVTADIDALRELIPLSVRELQKNDYGPEQLEIALRTVFTLDTQLIADGTYFVIEAEPCVGIVACGGWSRRRTLCGGDQHAVRDSSFLDPATDAAKIRAFFVHPQWARRGLGSRLLAACEEAAQVAGFSRLEMAATLTGLPLYRARGYEVVEHSSVPLDAECTRGDSTLKVVLMSRSVLELTPTLSSTGSR
jgi:GNAT superfamily N-acetyltransferase